MDPFMAMTATYYEYNFAEGDTVQSLIETVQLEEDRRQHSGRCYELACVYRQSFLEQRCLCGVLTFKNGRAFVDEGIRVCCELDNTVKTYTHHSVLFLGTCIIDLLHTDRLIAASEYVKRLKEYNPKLRIDNTMSDAWFDSNGFPIPVTLEKLESGNW